jgi:hypothetical protein
VAEVGPLVELPVGDPVPVVPLVDELAIDEPFVSGPDEVD